MAWNEQTQPGAVPGTSAYGGNYAANNAPQPQYGPNPLQANMAPNPNMPPAPAGAYMAPNTAPAANPNMMPQPPVQGGERAMPNERYNSPGAFNPNQQPQPQFAQPPVMAQPAAPVPMPQPMVPSSVMPGQSDDATNGDMLWIGRAKRAIAESHGDPYRQVQLIQQLRVMYLKERFGRVVKDK